MTESRAVERLGVLPSPAGHKVTYEFQIGERLHRIYFSCESVSLAGGNESAVAMSMLAAMAKGFEMVIEGPVSSTFMDNQRKLMKIFTGWFPSYAQVDMVSVDAEEVPAQPSGRTGSLFTGGVDSFYTFLKHRAEITDLVYVHGYDVALDDHVKREAISAMGRAIEAETGVRFIELETNCIRLFKDYGRWGLHGHGLALGAAARQLAGYLDRLYIPSSFAHAELMPWASHPDTDPLFSDERLEVVHDGCEASRADKVRMLAREPLALAHLRVCWEKDEGTYNCGRCEKCLRTMTSLHALGVLAECRTFPDVLDPAAVRGLVLYDESLIRFAEDNISFLVAAGLEDAQLCQAWQHILDRPPWKNRLILRGRKLRKQYRRAMDKVNRKWRQPR